MIRLLLLMLIFAGCVEAAPPTPSPPLPTPKPKRGNYAEIDSDAKYQVFLTKHSKSPHCQLFSAKWCGPCQQFAPIFKRVAANHKEVLFVKIDIDDCPDAAKMNGVSSIPTLIFRGKKYVGGLSEAQFETLLK